MPRSYCREQAPFHPKRLVIDQADHQSDVGPREVVHFMACVQRRRSEPESSSHRGLGRRVRLGQFNCKANRVRAVQVRDGIHLVSTWEDAKDPDDSGQGVRAPEAAAVRPDARSRGRSLDGDHGSSAGHQFRFTDTHRATNVSRSSTRDQKAECLSPMAGKSSIGSSR